MPLLCMMTIDRILSEGICDNVFVEDGIVFIDVNEVVLESIRDTANVCGSTLDEDTDKPYVVIAHLWPKPTHKWSNSAL